jgi:pimeloyl-ACP methyl ester carboxylesterase
VERVRDAIYDGELLELRTETDAWERVFLMRPHTRSTERLPVLVVPFYDVDTPAGRNLGGRRFVPPSVRSFAYMAVQRGFVAVAVRWFGESYGEGYDEAVANLRSRHPGVTGLGKWIWDAQRLLDWVVTLQGVDTSRIAVMGHSLGGKMALYAAAFEPRIRAVVASEPGIGLALTNYDDFWYLGENIARVPKGSDQHELIALIAPRPFLLIAGEDSDGDKSLPYMNAAKPAYGTDADRLAFFNHRKGHSPTPESVELALDWLRSAFTLTGAAPTQSSPAPPRPSPKSPARVRYRPPSRSHPALAGPSRQSRPPAGTPAPESSLLSASRLSSGSPAGRRR